MIRFIVIASLFLLPLSGAAQSRKKQKVSHAKGTLFGYWGYNRSGYTKSDLRFQGPGYDFTLSGAVAHDNPSTVTADAYLNPRNITVPQFNARIGYYFAHHWAFSMGYDHMKYIFKDGNEVLLSGTIAPGVDPETNWSGIYNAQPVTTNREQFHYENSNGLNYLRLELTRTDLLYAAGSKDQFGISSNLGVSAGSLLSFNDFTFAGQKNTATVSMSGYGLSAHAGLRFEFFKHVFLGTNISGGFHHQLKVRTRQNDPTSFARQKYGYYEYNAVIGFLFYIRPTNACDSCPVW